MKSEWEEFLNDITLTYTLPECTDCQFFFHLQYLFNMFRDELKSEMHHRQAESQRSHNSFGFRICWYCRFWAFIYSVSDIRFKYSNLQIVHTEKTTNFHNMFFFKSSLESVWICVGLIPLQLSIWYLLTQPFHVPFDLTAKSFSCPFISKRSFELILPNEFFTIIINSMSSWHLQQRNVLWTLTTSRWVLNDYFGWFREIICC